jgi:prepilin-type N-terminal cleavage/methylation domain-containing protein
MKNRNGMSLIELLIVLAIFSIVMAGLYSAYQTVLRQGLKEYRLAESEVELQIGRSVLHRDMAMAGYGLADDYGGAFSPVAIGAAEGTPDTLNLMGTALGREARSTQAWSYTQDTDATALASFRSTWDDPREILKDGDEWVIYIEPNVKRLLTVAPSTNQSTELSWLFPYPGSGTNPGPELEKGVLVYGLQKSTDTKATVPYYTVTYTLGGTPPKVCAPGTQNLTRSETRNNDTNPQPLLNCVLDFQVAFGLDSNGDEIIDCWDNGGQTAATYNNTTRKERLKQVRAFVLVQEGSMDAGYTYKNPQADPSTPTKVRVGDSLLTACGGGGVGREVTIGADQLHYRWRVITVSVTPRNLR